MTPQEKRRTLDTKPTNPKDMVGSDKIPFHLWPESATAMGALALLHGMLKYGRANWRAAGVRASIYYDACRRHLNKWWEGEDKDPDSGLHHLAHALACLAVVLDAWWAGKLVDDRQYPGGYVKAMDDLTPHVRRLKDEAAARSTGPGPHPPDPRHYTIQDAVDQKLVETAMREWGKTEWPTVDYGEGDAKFDSEGCYLDKHEFAAEPYRHVPTHQTSRVKSHSEYMTEIEDLLENFGHDHGRPNSVYTPNWEIQFKASNAR